MNGSNNLYGTLEWVPTHIDTLAISKHSIFACTLDKFGYILDQICVHKFAHTVLLKIKSIKLPTQTILRDGGV